jgi:hypothetical protein
VPDQTISDLFQDAVLLPFVRYDSRGGPVTGIAVQLPGKCRWEWNRTEMLDPKRNTIVVDATVRVAVDVKIDSIIGQGKLTDLTGTDASPNLEPPGGWYQVKAFKFVPDIDNRFISRVLGLLRFKGKLPTGLG